MEKRTVLVINKLDNSKNELSLLIIKQLHKITIKKHHNFIKNKKGPTFTSKSLKILKEINELLHSKLQRIMKNLVTSVTLFQSKTLNLD